MVQISRDASTFLPNCESAFPEGGHSMGLEIHAKSRF